MTKEAEEHLARAAQAQQNGRAADAVREAQAALRLKPEHPGAHNLLGVIALNNDDPETAARHFEAATLADPGAAALWMNLAKARRLLDDDEAERAALNGALETDQRHLMALIRLTPKSGAQSRRDD